MMEKQKRYENKVVFYTRFSLISTFFLAITKLVLGIFSTQLLIVSAIFSFIVLAIRLYGFKKIYLNERITRKDSYVIGGLLILASIIYCIYNICIIGNKNTYDEVLAIMIALVSFIEVGISLAGIIRTSRSDHMFKNLKLVSLSLALTSIVVTTIAILSFADTNYSMSFFSDYLGIVVAIIILFIGIYILFSYRLGSDESVIYAYFGKNDLNESIKLTNSYFYKEYVYEYKNENGIIAGHIIRTSSKLSKCPIYLKIIYGILSEILIFPYFIGLLIYTFKNMDLNLKLDNIMKTKGLTECRLFDDYFDNVVVFDKTELKDINLHELVQYLPNQIKKKYESITNEDYFTSSLLGYLLLVFELKKYFGFYYFPDYSLSGKPYDSNLGLYFNISHSKNIIALIISKEDVGIDVECYRHISDSLKRKYLNNIKDDKKATIKWTKLESILKLTGVGLKGIDQINIQNYRVKTIKYDNFSLSIAKNKKKIFLRDVVFFKYNKNS